MATSGKKGVGGGRAPGAGTGRELVGELHQGTPEGVTSSLGHIMQLAEYSGEFGRRRSG